MPKGKSATADKQVKNRDGRFQPGQSGNPNGRPKKGHSITEIIREMFDEKPEIKRKLGETILKKALQGDANAIKLVWSYLDGMPVQKNIVTDATLEDLIKSQEAAAAGQ